MVLPLVLARPVHVLQTVADQLNDSATDGGQRYVGLGDKGDRDIYLPSFNGLA